MDPLLDAKLHIEQVYTGSKKSFKTCFKQAANKYWEKTASVLPCTPTNEAIDLENICLLITEKIILFVPKNHMSFWWH